MIPVLVWLLCGFFCGSMGGPVRPLWSEEVKEDGTSGPSFYHLPVFVHAAGPVVPRELFRPVPYHGPVPAGLAALLIPHARAHQSSQHEDAPAVDVLCGEGTISVRVDLLQLRAWTVPSLFRLGSCAPSRTTPQFLFFQYGLRECNGEVKVVGGQLVYSYLLSYTPPPQGYVIRVFPLNLPIHCHYNRFHYSYKVGFRPQVHPTTFLKTLKAKLSFSLTITNAQWEPLPQGHRFYLGELVYFVARAKFLLAGEMLHVDSCYATSSEDKMDIITNYGCMMDSRREGSGSRFVSGGGSVVKFSVDAFLFRGVSQMQYLHCSLSVSLRTSHTSKSCNYNMVSGRWEELTASPSVCSCCDSVCTDVEGSFKTRVRSSGWLVGQKGEEKLEKGTMQFQAEEGRELVDQEEKWKDGVDVRGEDQETKTGYVEEKGSFNDRKRWKLGVTSQQEEEETEQSQKDVVVMKKAGSQLKEVMPHDGDDMTDNKTAAASGKVPYFSNDFMPGLSRDNTSFAVEFGVEYNPSNDGSEGDVSTIGSVCSERDNISCSGIKTPTPDERGSYTGKTGVNSESLSPDTGGNPLDAEDAGIHFATRKFETVFPEPRMSGKGGLEWNKLDDVLWAEEVNKSVSTLSRNVQVQQVDGSDEDLQVRALDLSGFRDLSCVGAESGFESGSEGGTPQQCEFTREVMKTKESSSEMRPESSSSVLASPEQIHEETPSHSTVVTATNTLQDQMIDRPWAEEVPEWDLKSLRFLVTKPAAVDQELVSGQGSRSLAVSM